MERVGPPADLLQLVRRVAPQIDAVATIDAETFYAADYTLSKMTTESYVRDPRYETIGVGVTMNGDKAWLEHHEFAHWARQVDWRRVAVINHHCVPGDVEVLTRNGWKPIRDVLTSEEVMQWDPATDVLSWVRPLGKIQERADTLLSWSTNHHRCAYTPGHRMFYCTPDVPQWRATNAASVARMSQNNVYIPMGGTFRSDVPLPLSAIEARLMEAVRADGCWLKRDSKCYGVQFKFVKGRKQQRLRALCDALGLVLEEQPEKTRPHVLCMYLKSSPLVQKLFQLMGEAKEYGQWVLELSVDAREAVLDEARFWDGSNKQSPSTGKVIERSYVWSCTRLRTVEAFQLLAHTTGWSFSGAWRDNQRGHSEHIAGARLYVATVSEKRRAKLVERPVELSGNYEVFCLTVPTGAFLVRSQDRVFVTGNCHFDGLILAYHYGVDPGFFLDTLSMARVFVPVDVGGSLGRLAEYFGIGKKGDEVIQAKGKRRADFTQEEWDRYGLYCLNDCALTDGLAFRMATEVPEDELVLIDMTIRAFTQPVLEVDVPLLDEFIVNEQNRKAALLARVMQDKSTLMSNDKFAQLLIEMGEEPPMKISAAKSKKAGYPVETYAFAKTDIGMQRLLESDNDEIRWLAEARVGVKSTINETRAQRFRGMGQRGKACVYLKYHGAHTTRFSGGDRLNAQNLPRGCPKHDTRQRDCEDCIKGTLRSALVAPPEAA